MTDQPTEGDAAATNPQPGQAKPPIMITAQYTKDLSFEAPGAPSVFQTMQQQRPDIDVNVDVRAQALPDSLFEVVLHIKAQCSVGETTAFIAELVYGGLFQIQVPREHLQPVLLIECPRLLFPFARAILADVTRDGGFPPLFLAPIDFVSMFQEQVRRRQAQAEAGAPPSTPVN